MEEEKSAASENQPFIPSSRIKSYKECKSSYITLLALCHTYTIVKEQGKEINWRSPLWKRNQMTTLVKLSDSLVGESPLNNMYLLNDEKLKQIMIARVPKDRSPENYNPANLEFKLEAMLICEHIAREMNEKILEIYNDETLHTMYLKTAIYEFFNHRFEYALVEDFISKKYDNTLWSNSRKVDESYLAQTLSHFSW